MIWERDVWRLVRTLKTLSVLRVVSYRSRRFLSVLTQPKDQNREYLSRQHPVSDLERLRLKGMAFFHLLLRLDDPFYFSRVTTLWRRVFWTSVLWPKYNIEFQCSNDHCISRSLTTKGSRYLRTQESPVCPEYLSLLWSTLPPFPLPHRGMWVSTV